MGIHLSTSFGKQQQSFIFAVTFDPLRAAAMPRAVEGVGALHRTPQPEPRLEWRSGTIAILSSSFVELFLG